MLAALDDDDTFRTRIAELLDPDTAGELGWLWLTRPEGWDIQIAAHHRNHRIRTRRRTSRTLAPRQGQSPREPCQKH